MSREYSLHLYTQKVEAGNRQSLLDALIGISEFDLDFNGQNGSDFTWDIALENGFESNMDYLINEVKDIEDDKECVNTFIKVWCGKDSYYEQYEVDWLTDEIGRIVVISFATMCGY